MEDDDVELIMERHTPTQIDLALQKLAHVNPQTFTRLVTQGRFGFRKGFKQGLRENQAPPRPAESPTSPNDSEDPACQARQQEALARLAERYLGTTR